MNEATLEQRLKALEQSVGELQRQVGFPDNWLQKMTGCVTDQSALREAYEAGREYRTADRPADEADETP